jgi:hypothetical protein
VKNFMTVLVLLAGLTPMMSQASSAGTGGHMIQITGSDADSIAASITPEKLADGSKSPVKTVYDKEGNVLMRCSREQGASQHTCLITVTE